MNPPAMTLRELLGWWRCWGAGATLNAECPVLVRDRNGKELPFGVREDVDEQGRTVALVIEVGE